MLGKKPFKARKGNILDGRAYCSENNPDISIRRNFLVEGYKHRNCTLHFHFLPRDGPWHRENGFCAIIAGSGESVHLGSRRINDSIPSSNSGDRERYPSMLVDVRELLQDREAVFFLAPLASVVRLQSLDLCERLWGHAEKGTFISAFSASNGGVVEGFAGTTDRELVTFLGMISNSEYKLPYKIVEGTAEAMNAVSDYERDVLGDRNLDAQALNLTPRTWIRLDSQFAQVGVRVPKFLGIERVEVCLSPLDFLPDRSK